MGILSLTLENWKSYEGKHVIPLCTFTAIVGPNGAGKSNVMDAISFVLGVRTAKLRGKQMSDHIHRKEYERDAPVKRNASVEIHYQHEDGSGDLFFRRSITYEGTARYHVNKKVVKWPQYNEKLKSIGVLVRARNFLVFQGDVESIAQKSPKELTALFEQISGSAALIARYDETHTSKEKAEDQLAIQLEKRRNINKEKRQLKDQADEANKYKRMVKEQAEMKKEFFLWQLFHIEEDIKMSREQIEADTEQLEQIKVEYEEKANDVKEKNKEIARLTRGKLKREKEIADRQKTLEIMMNAKIKREEQNKHSERVVKKAQKDFERAKKAFDDNQARIQSLEEDQKELLGEQKEFEALVNEEASQELQVTDSQRHQYDEAREEVAEKTASKRQKVESLKQDNERNEAEQQSLSSIMASLEQRRTQLVESRAKLEAQLKTAEETLSTSSERLKELKKERNEIVREEKSNNAEKEHLRKQLDHNQRKLQNLKADQRMSERDRKMNETIETLKRLFSGVHGRITDVMRPIHKKYRMAVMAALGGHNMDAIVTETEKTATECIRYLKENHVGKASFIPLDTIVTKPINEQLRHIEADVKLVIDVVEYEEQYGRAMLYVFGNTILCDTLDRAREMCYSKSRNFGKLKGVSLDGSLIAKNGNMSGGVQDFLKRASRFDDREVNQLQKKVDKCLSELRALEHKEHRSNAELAPEITNLEKSIQYNQMEVDTFREKLEENGRKLGEIDDELKSKQPALKKVTANFDKSNAKFANASKEVQRIEDEVFVDFCSAVGVDNVREYEAKLSGINEKHNSKRLEFADRESRLKGQLEYERNRKLAAPMKRVEKRVEAEKKKLDKLRGEQKNHEAQIDEDTTQIESMTEDMNRATKDIDVKRDVLKALKKAAVAVKNKAVEIEKDFSEKETQVEKLRDLKRDLLNRSRLEQIEIPLVPEGEEAPAVGSRVRKRKDSKKKKKGKKSGGGRRKRRKTGRDSSMSDEDDSDEDDDDSDDDEEMKDDSPASQSSSLNTELDENDLLDTRIDYSSLPEDPDDMTAAQYENRRNTFLKELDMLATTLVKLNPNLKAIDQYEEIEKRANEVAEEFQAARKVATDAATEFDSVEKERTDLFNKAYTKVDAKIDSIYKKLTYQELSTGKVGGSAFLTLENPEQPFLHGITYTAMPPSKRFRDMDQLSGGERTVAALALLFAIHSHHPSPFFVLDEIDAALDAGNVNKVANYIRHRSHVDNLQCIVISLKDTFYYMADELVGIYRDQEKHASGTLTLDLRAFDEPESASIPSSQSDSSRSSVSRSPSISSVSSYQYEAKHDDTRSNGISSKRGRVARAAPGGRKRGARGSAPMPASSQDSEASDTDIGSQSDVSSQASEAPKEKERRKALAGSRRYGSQRVGRGRRSQDTESSAMEDE